MRNWEVLQLKPTPYHLPTTAYHKTNEMARSSHFTRQMKWRALSPFLHHKTNEMARSVALALALFLAAVSPAGAGLRLNGGSMSDGAGLSAAGRGHDLDALRARYAAEELAPHARSVDLDALRASYSTPSDARGEGGGYSITGGDLDELRRGYGGRARRRRRDAGESDGLGSGRRRTPGRKGRSASDTTAPRGVERAVPRVDTSHDERAAGVCRQGMLARLREVLGQCLPVFVHARAEGAEEAGCTGYTHPTTRTRTEEPPRRGNLAEHRVHAPRKGDENSELRGRILDSALEELGVDPRTLQDDDAAGNPARKAYYSFINPRPDKQMLGVRETLARGARRFAKQVAVLDRAYRSAGHTLKII